MDRGCFECGSKRSSFQLVRVSGAPSGSLSSFWRVPRQSSVARVGARYTRVKGTRRGLARCVEEGGILLVSGTPRPSSRVPLCHLLSCHWVTSLCLLAVSLSVPTEHPRVHVLLLCWLCSEASFFFLAHGTANPFINPQGLRANLQQLGVRLSRARDFCWGSPRPDGKMHVGTLSSFNSRPGWAGLVWPVVFFLPQPWGGAIKGRGGFQGTANQRHRPPNGRCSPGAITVWAHRLQQTGPDADGRRTTDGWMIKLTALANAKPQKSKPTNHYVHIVNGRVCC